MRRVILDRYNPFQDRESGPRVTSAKQAHATMPQISSLPKAPPKDSGGREVTSLQQRPSQEERPRIIIPMPGALPRIEPTPTPRFQVLQKWEGVVLDVTPDSFHARLTDLTGNAPQEEAELLLEDVPPDDRELVAPGGIFYWSVGYLDVFSGQRMRSSAMRFRRLPSWGSAEITAARNRARSLAEELDWK
jgi:hypothetical protein